jgi:hypothetical protein
MIFRLFPQTMLIRVIYIDCQQLRKEFSIKSWIPILGDHVDGPLLCKTPI